MPIQCSHADRLVRGELSGDGVLAGSASDDIAQDIAHANWTLSTVKLFTMPGRPQPCGKEVPPVAVCDPVLSAIN